MHSVLLASGESGRQIGAGFLSKSSFGFACCDNGGCLVLGGVQHTSVSSCSFTLIFESLRCCIKAA